MSSRSVPIPLAVLLSVVMLALAPATGRADRPDRGDRESRSPAWTIEDLFASPAPYAMGHRGYGEDAYHPLPPLENTLDAFHQAFRDGIRVVELDLQQTADGKVVVFHDDYLEDFRCVRSMTYDELLARHPQVPLFRAVLNSSRRFGHDDRLSGLLFAEIKVPVPLCDGANTSEQAEVSESALVAAVVADIRQSRMEDQVILNSGSPSILKRAAEQAPEIERALTLNVLQLLTPAEVEAITRLPVVKIPKNDCGLDWYNIGPIARLPAMPGSNGNERFGSFIGVAVGCARSSAVSLDKRALLQNPAAAPVMVGAVHGAGLEAIAWTVDSQAEWDLLASAGVDGITTNIALGSPSHRCPNRGRTGHRHGDDGDDDRRRDRDNERDARSRACRPGGQDLRLALDPPRGGPSHDGSVLVRFALPDGAPARLELLDIAGRRVASSEVGSLGPGRHEFPLGRALPSGIYLVRLDHPQGQARAKVAVVR
jgi:glycerophosphoryl diester phosphodiesterase